MIQAIFFDRDGVLNEEVGYLWEVEKFKWIDGARDAIKFCNERGILTIVVTNQGGIAKNLYTAKEVNTLHDFIQKSLSEIGAHIDGFYFCPHHPEGSEKKFSVECDCRKPKPGMILQACKDFKINPAQAIMFGDSERDIKAAEAAGLRAGIFFTGGNLLDAVKIHCTEALS
ncbi:MAG: HAD family hydrolase [Selenomonadaceae bacterium]|nr:HAD family hydrolase [Selenomonadaceae bacterium]